MIVTLPGLYYFICDVRSLFFVSRLSFVLFLEKLCFAIEQFLSNFTYIFLQGKSGLAARRLFEIMTQGPPIVALIGPSLSSEMTVVGQIGPFYDVLQVRRNK